MKRDYPLAWDYLNRNKRLLESREKGKFKDAGGIALGAPKSWQVGTTQDHGALHGHAPCSYLDNTDGFYFVNVTTGGYGVRDQRVSCFPTFVAC